MNKGTISILGCGWLGLPLGKFLISKGFSVKGSVTDTNKFEILSDAGISPYRIVLNETVAIVVDQTFFDCEVLIISIPPRRTSHIERIFPAKIAQLIPFILESGLSKVLFISSTSVYPDKNQLAEEDDTLVPDKDSGRALLLAENLLNNLTDFQTTVLRFGGLIGADRNPARFLQKSTVPVPNSPVNLIHQDDCIGIISAIIEQDLWGETLNACSPEHPLKKDFYSRAAQISGLPEPLISDKPEAYKIVDSSKLMRLLNYRFKYPSPIDYLEHMEQVKK